MGRKWQIGDPVDYSTDGWMDAQNWGHDRNEDRNRTDIDFEFKNKSDKYAKKAWDYYLDGKDESALNYINNALDLDDKKSNYWNIKAIILESLELYFESEKHYLKSLELSKSNVVFENYARMLYKWSIKLREYKEQKNGLDYLTSARKKITKAMDILPENSNEDINNYIFQRDTIDYYINYERKFQENIEILNGYKKEELFTIAGRKFNNNNINLTQGMQLRLVKEKDNEFDRDAIAVYAQDKKIGYVANSDYTRYKLTSKASELKDKIPDNTEVKFLFHLERYFDIHFDIGTIK